MKLWYMCDCKITGDIGYSFKTTYRLSVTLPLQQLSYSWKKGWACEQNLLTPLRINPPLSENWQEIKLAPSIHHLLPREMAEEHPLSLYHLLQEVPGELILILHYLRATKSLLFYILPPCTLLLPLSPTTSKSFCESFLLAGRPTLYLWDFWTTYSARRWACSMPRPFTLTHWLLCRP